LRFARADEPDLDIRRFELAPLVDEVIASVGTAGDKPVACVNTVDASIVVQADRDQLFRVIMNLARNAVEAMAKNGGELTVSARRGETETVIEVADTGPGIPERIKSRLFEAFAGGSRGTGLGLAIARELMRAHGGELVLAETGPEGSTFRMTLPSRDEGRRTSNRRTRASRDEAGGPDLRQTA
jgi:signal transduction histidine kinase